MKAKEIVVNDNIVTTIDDMMIQLLFIGKNQKRVSENIIEKET